MRSAPVLVVAAALLMTAVPAAAQSPVRSGIRLVGDPPQTVTPDSRREASFTIEYEYLGPLTTDSETTVHLSVTRKPEWLEITHQETVSVPVDKAGTRSTKNVSFGFEAKQGRFPPAFHQNAVTIAVQAEPNGAVGGSNNTLSGTLQVGYVPGLVFRVDRLPVRLQPGSPETVTIDIQNKGNAAVQPTLRLVEVPSGLDVGIASQSNLIGTPSTSEGDSSGRVSLVLQDDGATWSQSTLRVEIAYRPTMGESKPRSEMVDILVVRSNGLPVAAIGFTTIVGLGAALYWLKP